MLVHRVRKFIEEATRAQGEIAHIPAGMTEPTGYVTKLAAVGGVIGLLSEQLPNVFDREGKLTRVPPRVIAATTVPLSTGIIANSRVAQAGAHVIVRPDQDKAIPMTKERGFHDLVLQKVAGAFRTISPAAFATVADDAEVGDSEYPALSAKIDWSTAVNKAVRFEITRAKMSELGSELIAAEVIASIVLGVANAADELLLSTIGALPLEQFTLQAAAAQGLRYHELRAIAGPTGDGSDVGVGADGTLRAQGVPAEMVPVDTGHGAMYGAWDRAAIAIHEDMPLHFERTKRTGRLVCTAHVTMIPLVPDAAKFWTSEESTP